MSITLFPDRLAILEHENERLRQENALLASQNTYLFEREHEWIGERASLLGRIATLEVRIEDLERGRRKNSTNSSLPPSSDRVKPAPRSSRPPRRRGGQRGHGATGQRDFGPPDRTVDVPVASCNHCGADLSGQPELPGRRHIQAEWVERPVEVVEYHYPVKVCHHCWQKTEAPEAPGVLPGTRLGPRLHAQLALFHRWGQTSLEKIAHMFTEDFGLPLPEPTLLTALERVNEALAVPYALLKAALPQSEVVGVDETGWRIEGEEYYTWAFVTPRLSYITIAKTRSHLVPEQVLGKPEEFKGVVVSDFFDVYDAYGGQRCLAHLRRDLKACQQEHDPVCKAFAGEALDNIARGWEMWRRYQRDPGYFPNSREAVSRIKAGFRAYLDGLPASVPEPVRLLRQRFNNYWEEIWYFLDHPNVPPDNNLAERGLRPTVTFRKMSGGSRSEWGAELTARMMSVLDTCRKQGRNPRDFLVQAMLAHANPGCYAVPSLLETGKADGEAGPR